jgi:hypothetical protein
MNPGFLILELDGGEWAASHPFHFIPWRNEWAPGTQGRPERPCSKQNCLPVLDSNSYTSVSQSVANRYTDCTIKASHLVTIQV